MGRAAAQKEGFTTILAIGSDRGGRQFSSTSHHGQSGSARNELAGQEQRLWQPFGK
jgi:hypothetical protein